MASDISSIVQGELINTFESLLSLQTEVDNISQVPKEDISSEQCIEIKVKFSSKEVESSWVYYLPTLISTKFEYYMLGGIGDLKSSIDDEIVDATKEIISTICGSLSTSVNAQDFEDLSKVQCSVESGGVIQVSDIANDDNLYKVEFKFNNEPVELYIQFDEAILPYLEKFVSGQEIENEEEEEANANDSKTELSSATSSVLSLLGDEASENLKLLFDVSLKFSVRLGTKTFLLKDIVNWDVGQIIELEQMVNEPLDILINGVKIGEGEAVIVESKFGVKIKNIGEKKIEV